ncbi:MAG: SPOR domain-containing protein [Candidatus Omnitrophica bacterium]|nr:SPOR domain-containing protein [Candidatus Omnitrophota bacterium]
MQNDLFEIPHEIPATKPAQKLAFLERSRISLRLDHFVLCLIVFMVFYVFIFSFGVEKGKRFAMAELKAERAKRQHVTEELTKRIFEAKQLGSADEPEVRSTVSIAPAADSPASLPDETPTEITVQGKYTIQLVTYTSEKQAHEKIKILTEKGRKGFVIPSGKYKQVCVDGFSSRENALQVLRQLKSEGIAPRDAYVRPLPAGIL